MNNFISVLATFFQRRRIKLVLQAEMLECAHACLCMVATYYGQAWSLEAMRERFTPSARGTSVSQLAKMAQGLGLNARIFRAEPSHLSQLTLPCILHWDVVHFVVLESCAGGFYELADPAMGRMRIGEAEFSRRFTGIAIEMMPGIDFKRQRATRDMSALALLREGLRDRIGTLSAIVSLALMLEVLALISPLFIQVATDSVVPANDTRLLWVLAIAFFVSTLIQAVVALSRSSLLIKLGENLTVSWNSAVCGRLLQLPYIFFMRRSIGDIHSRFGSIEEVQRVITHRFVEGILDGATAIFTLAIIFMYSSTLALLTLCFAALYGLLRLASLSKLLQATDRSIRMQAAQHGLLLELLHGIHSIKANGHEPNQLARYNRKTRDAAKATMQVQQWSGSVDELGQLILRAHWIAAVALGAALAIKGAMTAGMLVAYVTYAYQFSMRSSRLLDLASEWRMLLLHGVRLSDIVSSPLAARVGTEPLDPDRSDFEIRKLGFRYSADGPWILRDVSFAVRSGECVAIKGVSGSGKSTLAKLLVGLLETGEGEILLGGRDIGALKQDDLRSTIACVLQDDQLFGGTIAENIAFFEPAFSREKVVETAKLAQMHSEIMSMPLRYDTRLIDLGASLSGGQRQRIILARALYRDPRILILDEASSHLDLENERLINKAISSLKITRIIIAHRRETLAIADRVLELMGGRFVDYEGEQTRPPVEVDRFETGIVAGLDT